MKRPATRIDPSIRLGAAAFGLALVWHSATAAAAEPAPSHDATEEAAPSFKLAAALGYAWFARSRSLAPPHLFKPSLAVSGMWPLTEALELGAMASGIIDTNENYQVAGLYGVARYEAHATDSFTWGASLGLGVGNNAAILHSDLKAEAPVLPYVRLATDVAFRLSDALWLGAEVADEQLSVVHLGAKVTYEF